jgi:hypothetical protein
MLCQLCLAAGATQHLFGRRPSGRIGVAHYCRACYEAKYLKPAPATGGFPRPRFTLKHAMSLVAAFAILNALVASVMGSGLIRGTPTQLRQWTSLTFLAVNCGCGIFVSFVFFVDWLVKAHWFKKTGGLAPMPPVPPMTLKQIPSLLAFLVALFFWLFASAFLTEWLTPTLWPMQARNSWLFMAISCGPMLVLLVWWSVGHPLVARLKVDWKSASGPERAWKVALILYPIAFPLALESARLPAPPFVVVFIGGMVILLSGLMLATGRR